MFCLCVLHCMYTYLPSWFYFLSFLILFLCANAFSLSLSYVVYLPRCGYLSFSLVVFRNNVYSLYVFYCRLCAMMFVHPQSPPSSIRHNECSFSTSIITHPRWWSFFSLPLFLYICLDTCGFTVYIIIYPPCWVFLLRLTFVAFLPSFMLFFWIYCWLLLCNRPDIQSFILFLILVCARRIIIWISAGGGGISQELSSGAENARKISFDFRNVESCRKGGCLRIVL